jgi:hypothetical protein
MMKRRILLAALVAVASTAAAAAARSAESASPGRDASTVALAQLGRDFVCPEALPDQTARNTALANFFGGYSRAKPDATLLDMIAFRQAMLAQHGCSATLGAVQAANAAAEAGDDFSGQLWWPVAETGAFRLSVSLTYVRDVLDPRAPEDRPVELLARLTLPASAETSATHTRYDEVFSRSIYYCRSARYALVENDYFLGGKRQLHDPSPVGRTPEGTTVYKMAPIPPGSPNAAMAAWACRAPHGGVAANPAPAPAG